MKNIKYVIVTGVIIVVFTFGLILLASQFQQRRTPEENNTATGDEKLNVAITLFPYADIVQMIGKERVDVSIVGEGVDPHDFEPTPEDIITLKNADLIIYNGLGIDQWVENVLLQEGIGGDKVVNVSEFVDLIPNIEGDEQSFDPHIWMSIDNMIIISQTITDALIIVESDHEEEFQRNVDEVSDNLRALKTRYNESLTNCRLSEAFVDHNAFSYLGRDFDIEVVSLRNIEDEEDVSPQQIQTFTERVRSSGTSFVLIEEHHEDESETSLENSLERVASELGVEELEINTSEVGTFEDIKNGKGYIHNMDENRVSLAQALECN